MSAARRNPVLYAVRKLLPYLADLVGPSQASALEPEIRSLLRRSRQGEAVDNLLLDRLTAPTAPRAIRLWLQSAVLLTPGISSSSRGYQPLGGDPSLPARSWVCPIEGCSFTWYQPKKGAPIPPCPRHQQPLVPRPPRREA